MQKLLSLFVIYAFFIVLSFVVGYGASLIQPSHSQQLTGVLLIFASLVSLFIFIMSFRGSR